MTIFEQYAISATHLYGLVPVQQVLYLYNRHHGTSLTRFDAVDPEVLLKAFVYEENGWFLHEAIYINDLFNAYLRDTEGKPYYLPSQAELLRYFDDEYIENPASYSELESFIMTRTKKEPEEIALELRDMLFHGFSMSKLITSYKSLAAALVSSALILLPKISNLESVLTDNAFVTNLVMTVLSSVSKI